MTELSRQPHNIIPIKDWTDEQRRTTFEQRARTPLADYGFEFTGQFGLLRGVDVIAETVASRMNRDFGDDAGFRSFEHERFENPGGSFSAGIIVFGAASRELANRQNPTFVHEVNQVLGNLGLAVRLDDQRIPQHLRNLSQ